MFRLRKQKQHSIESKLRFRGYIFWMYFSCTVSHCVVCDNINYWFVKGAYTHLYDDLNRLWEKMLVSQFIFLC